MYKIEISISRSNVSILVFLPRRCAADITDKLLLVEAVTAIRECGPRGQIDILAEVADPYYSERRVISGRFSS